MKKARTMVLYCGEAVYPKDWLNRRMEDISTGLAGLPLEIVHADTVLDESDARRIATAGCINGLDLILCVFVSWHITGNIMQILREYPNAPVLVVSASGETDAGGKLHSPAGPAGITALLPHLRDLGVAHKAIWQKPGSPFPYEDIAAFANVARTRQELRHSRIGLIGYADMGLYSCTYDRSAVSRLLGIDVEDHFSYEIGQLMEAVSPERLSETVAWIKKTVTFENDVSEQTLEKAARLYCAMKDKAATRELAGISIKCVQGVTKYMGINPCMAQSLLATADLSVICECDAYGLITNVMLSQLSGQPSTFLEHYEFYEDEILIGTCGFLPFGFSDGKIVARSTNLGDFFVGLGSTSKVRPGEMTYARLFWQDTGFSMFIGKGTARPPMKWIELGWEEPSPDFPSILLKLEIPMSEYVNKVPGQHIILVHGDWVEQLSELCRLMNIKVIR